MVRWYPASWRERYGDEFEALLIDTYGEERIPAGVQVSLMRAAIVEHLRTFGRGDDDVSSHGLRLGFAFVLCGWALLFISGCAFAKMTEHWSGFTPRGDRIIPTISFDAVEVAAGAGVTLFLTAAVTAFAAFSRFVRNGGWAKIARPVRRALLTVAAMSLLSFGILVINHAVPSGGSDLYVGWIWAISVSGTISTGALAAAAVARHLPMRQLLLRFEAWLALLLTPAMFTIFGGALAWTVSTAIYAPQLLSGSGSGLLGVPGPPAEIITGLVMLSGLLLGLGGSWQVARSLRAGA